MMTNTCIDTIAHDGVSTKIAGVPKPWVMVLHNTLTKCVMAYWLSATMFDNI